MSGKRLTKSDRRIVNTQRRYAKRIAAAEIDYYGSPIEGTKAFRSVARIGK